MFEMSEHEYDGPTKRNQRVKKYNIKNAYKIVSWVYSCINIIADSISGVPLIFYTIGKDNERIELPKEHPLMHLFNPPKQWQIPSIVELVKLLFINLGLFGEIFMKIEKKGIQPIDISLMSPFSFEPVFKKGMSDVLDGWKEKDASGIVKKVYKPGDLLQFKYPNPYSPWRGMSPLLVTRLSVEQELNMSIWNADFFKSGARNPFAITTKSRFNAKQRKEKMKDLRTNYMGFINGQLPLLLDGDSDVKSLMNSLKDIDFFEGKQLSREEICSIYNVPPALVGIYRYANYANSKAQEKIFWQNCNVPKMTYFLSVIQTGLLNIYYPDVWIDFDWDDVDVLQVDPKVTSVVQIRKAQTVKIYMESGYTRSDIAKLLNDPNLNPEVNEPDKPEEPEEPEEPIIPEEAGIIQVVGKDIEIVDNIMDDCIDLKVTDQFVDSFRQGYKRNVLDKYEPKLLKLIKSFLDNAGKELFEYVKKNKTVATLSEIIWMSLWKNLAIDIIEKIYYDGIRKSVSDIESPKTMLDFSVKVPTDITSILDDYQLIEMKNSINMINDKTVGLSTKMISQLNATSSELIMQGASLEQIGRGIQDKVGEVFKTNSLTVARTVTGSAYNTARFQGAISKGGRTHTWVDAGDMVVRRTHNLENTNEVIIGERFPVTQLLYPLDPAGKPQEIINCRCSTFISSLKKPKDRLPRPTTISIESPQRDLYNKVREAEVGIRYNNNESAVIFNKEGKIILEKTGGKDYVGFTNDEIKKIKGSIFTHNHPKSRSFSKEDVKFAFEGELSEIRVTSAEYQYSLTSMRGDLNPNDLKEVMQVHSIIKQKMNTKLLTMLEKNIITVEQANNMLQHLIMKDLTKELKNLGLVYQRHGLI